MCVKCQRKYDELKVKYPGFKEALHEYEEFTFYKHGRSHVVFDKEKDSK